MQTDRRTLLKAGGVTLASSLLAGCNALGGEQEENGNGKPNGNSNGKPKNVTANAAVAAEWNAMRARLHDAFALGIAGEFDAGASVAADIFARFEKSSGEWGAHEKLEHTSEKHYEEFEEALGQLKTALKEKNQKETKIELDLGNKHLRKAQVALVGETNVGALDLQLLGARFEDAATLAGAGKSSAAKRIAEQAFSEFEKGSLHDDLESASSETYESFESAAKTTISAAKKGKQAVVRKQANNAVTAAVSGSYELGTENTAGAGHLAVMQAQAFDAKALASLGGPSTSFAHATTLNTYRTRAADSEWLAAQGATKQAKQMATDIYAHFEGAKAHEALEHADHDAYEKFEHGLEELAPAAGKGNSKAIEHSLGEIDSSLRKGIETLVGETEAAILQSGFFRARFGDAMELHAQGKSKAAATIAQSLFERFEKDELGFHETLEHESEKLYERFEHEHLKEGLIPALKNGNDPAAKKHFEGVLSALLDFEKKAGSASLVSGAEATFMAGRAFDAAEVATLGDTKRAKSVVESTYEHFENGAGGYHESLEHANHDRYESFEKALGSVGGGDDTYAKSKQFGNEAIQSVYTIVKNAGGDFSGPATTVVQDTFKQFEQAKVHEALEHANHATYETFEKKLIGYTKALKSGEGVDTASEAFASAALRAQFAVVGEVGKAPVGKRSGEKESKKKLKGGPNVQQGVASDADHVVEMKAVSFAPKKLTIKKGDTVAWKHVGGEPHSVTAFQGKIPDGANYWASGGFESEDAAKEGWENGKGAVQSGQSFVHTFETKGTYEYYCVPHEAAGMTGTIVVE
ncbi:DUF5059 domain-containing protein [Haladaptatus sp. NG-SE-30]